MPTSRAAIGIRAVKIVEKPAVEPLGFQRLLDGGDVEWHRMCMYPAWADTNQYSRSLYLDARPSNGLLIMNEHREIMPKRLAVDRLWVAAGLATAFAGCADAPRHRLRSRPQAPPRRR